MNKLNRTTRTAVIAALVEGNSIRATAKHRGGETLAAESADLFRTLCDLAEQAGIELEDG